MRGKAVSDPPVCISLQYHKKAALVLGFTPSARAAFRAAPKLYEQKRCLPITTIRGLDQIHLLVAVAGLK